MKDLIQTIFKSTEDRLKNPFIGSFITSAILFNWRPISYFIFSPDNIKDKIIYIDNNFNHPLFYLWLPLGAAIFYIGILPYVSLIFEYVAKFSINYRNDISLEARAATLKLQIEVEKNAITLEEEKTTFRERKSHNEMVVNLQTQITNLTDKLDHSNQKNNELNNSIIHEKEKLNLEINDLNVEYNNRFDIVYQELSNEKMNKLSVAEKYKELKSNSDKIVEENKNLNFQNKINQFIIERLKNPQNKIVRTGDHLILEYISKGNEITFFDLSSNKIIDAEETLEFYRKNGFRPIIDDIQIKDAIKRMIDYLTPEQRILLL